MSTSDATPNAFLALLCKDADGLGLMPITYHSQHSRERFRSLCEAARLGSKKAQRHGGAIRGTTSL